MQPLVSIIILNWNGKRWLEACLDSVLKTEYDNFQVYVVDNGSTDGSDVLIRDKYPMVTLIQNHRNLGFAEGNNVGIRRAIQDGADYIALLNQDTKVDPSWLGPIVEVAESNPTIGILSPMQMDYEGNSIDINFHKILRDETSYEEDLNRGELCKLYNTTWAIGAALILSRRLCEQVGLYDPLYFLYEEERDRDYLLDKGFPSLYITF